MGSILALVGILGVIGLVSVWVMRRKTEDQEMDSTQWIDSDFSNSHSHAEHSSDGDSATDSGGESSGDGGGSGSDSGGSGGD